MSVSCKVIGRHIQEARKRMKLTQRDVAEQLNMSDTYYGNADGESTFLQTTKPTNSLKLTNDHLSIQ